MGWPAGSRGPDANYYLGENDLSPEWTGALREHFRLERDVDHEHFARLLANKDPHTGEKITKAQRKDRDPGRDLTFSAPKSVSIAALVGGDDRIVAAHHRTVLKVLAMAEADVNTRVRKEKADYLRTTANWLVAVFTHLTGRPMKTKLPSGASRMEPDPQLHGHAVAPNLTLDPTENEIKAIHFQELKRNAGYYEAAYHALLANEMQQLGYETRRTKHAFELVGIPEAAITQFSRRKEEVEKKAAELGIKNPESKAKLGATTRLPKEKATTKWEFLVSDWRERLQPDDLAAVDRTVQAAREGGPIAREEGERAAVDWAIWHEFSRKSALPERKLAETALRHGIGSVTPEGIAAELAGRDFVWDTVKGIKTVSTQEVLFEEARLVEIATAGRGTFQPIGRPGARIPETLTHGEEEPPSRSQADAMRHLWQSRDRVTLLGGKAGVGKTKMLKAALDQSPLPYVALATGAEASRGELRKAGIEDANTVSEFLRNKELQAKARNGLVVLDESSMTGTEEALKLFELVIQLNARLVVTGDESQHKSVARGDLIRLLKDEARLPVATVSDIKRQRGEYLKATELMAAGKVRQGFEKLAALGWVKNDGLVDDYLAAVKAGKEAIIIAPTHAEGDRITAVVRERLKAAGKITGKEVEVLTLRNLNYTAAELEEAKKQPPPDIVLDRFGAYVPETKRLAKGDAIRITANRRDVNRDRVDNGSILTVTGFGKNGEIEAKTVTGLRRVLPAGFQHWTHAAVLTTFASQGKSERQVFVSMPRSTFGAVNEAAGYVAATRGKEQVRFYTDDQKGLLDAVQKQDDRLLAHDLLRRRRFAERMRAFTSRMVAAVQRHVEHTQERKATYERY